jgi:hypothetical protein
MQKNFWSYREVYLDHLTFSQSKIITEALETLESNFPSSVHRISNAHASLLGCVPSGGDKFNLPTLQ